MGESASLEMRMLELLKQWESSVDPQGACFRELINLHEILSRGERVYQLTMGTPDWFFDFAPWNPEHNTLLIRRGERLVTALQNRGDGVVKLTSYDPIGPSLYRCLVRLGLHDVSGLPNRLPVWQGMLQEMEACCFSGSQYEPIWLNADELDVQLKAFQLSENFLLGKSLPANYTACELSLLYRQNF